MLTGLSLLSILVVLHVFNASHMIDKISWVRWILYVVALFYLSSSYTRLCAQQIKRIDLWVCIAH